MKKFISILAFATLVVSAQAEDNCSKVGTKEIALEAIKREALGASLSEQFTCFTSYPLKHVRAVWNPPNEGFREFELGIDIESIKVNDLTLIDDFTGQYKVDFEVKTTSQFGNKVVKDKMVIATKLSDSMGKKYGCAFTLEIPAKAYLAETCYKDALKKMEEEDKKE